MKKKLKRKLSQNFLINKDIVKKIIEKIKIKKEDIVVEIGPGDGALSNHVFRLSNNVTLIEIDNNLVESLKKNVNNVLVKIYNDDILKFDFKSFFKKNKKIRLIGNIPYKISSNILFRLIEIKKNLLDVHLLIQKEFANKLIKKETNVLVLLIIYYFKIVKFFDVDPFSFKPVTRVESSFIKLTPYKNKKNILNFEIFKKIIKNFLKKRRKSTLNFYNKSEIYNKYINVYKKSSNINLLEYIRICNLFTVNKD